MKRSMRSKGNSRVKGRAYHPLYVALTLFCILRVFITMAATVWLHLNLSVTLSTSYIHNTHHLPLSKKKTKMAPKKEKDIVAHFIQGPSMDWAMDDGLYSHFQTWKISCNLIMDSELCELSEVRKINTLLHWSSDFGIKKLKPWQKEPSQLMLNFI